MGVNGGTSTPKWTVYDGKKSTDDLPPPGCGNPHMSANLPAEKLEITMDHVTWKHWVILIGENT
jgi:hypothetical protein